MRLASSNLPLSFEPNFGQVPGPAEFVSAGRGYHLELSRTEAVLNLIAPVSSKTPGAAHRVPSRSPHTDQLRLKLIGANQKASGRGINPLAAKSFYFLGSTPALWHTNIPNFGRVLYKQIYPGIDLVYYGNQQQLEYDFMLQPGADPGAIRLRVEGARKMAIDSASGDLILSSAGGEVRLRKPSLYQVAATQRREIAGNFQVLKGEEVSFSVGPYDHSLPLVIDPVLQYATYVGQTINDQVNGIALGLDETAYVAGIAAPANTSGVNQAFVAHLSDDGKTLLYIAYLGGNDVTDARAIAVDASGNAYITGETKATNFPVQNALQAKCSLNAQSECAGDAYLVKLNSDGSMNFATYLGGSGEDAGNAITVDSSNNIYIAGSTASTDFPIIDALQSSTGGSGDAFLAEISSDDLHELYGSYLGGTGADEALGIALDQNNNIYVTGQTKSLNFPVEKALQPTCKLNASNQCAGEAFVTEFQAGGDALVYSTYLGGSGGDSGNAIAVDTNGNAYIAGQTGSTDFPTQNPLQASLKGTSDGFIAKLLAGGNQFAYSTYFGGSGADQANALAIDQSGDAYISGYTNSADFPTLNALQTACAQNQSKSGCSQDAFVAVLNTSGSGLKFSTYLGGSGADQGNGIALDGNGGVFLGGSTTSSNFPSAQEAIPPANLTYTGVPGGGIVVQISGVGGDPSANCTGSITWIGAAGDNEWTTPTNWSTGVLPGATDTVCIGPSFGSNTITISGISSPSNQTVASLVSNANINFTGGPLTVTGGATFENSLTISSGTLTLNGTNGSDVGTTMTMSGGTLSGTDTLTVTGPLTWSSGYMCTTLTSGSCAATAGPQGITNANGGMILSTGYPYLEGRTLNTTGTVSASVAYYMEFGYGAIVNNAAGGTWNLAADYNLYTTTGAGTFNNAGTFEKTVGTSGSTIGASFDNTGSVVAVASTLNFQGAFTQTSGTTFLDGGTIETASPLQIQGGTISGSGTIVGGAANAAGTLAPGTSSPSVSNGAIAFSNTASGTYAQSATGQFAVKLGGTAAGQFDSASASGAVTLGSALNVTLINGYTPAIGDSFTILSAASVTGTFSTSNLPALPAGSGWKITYNPASVVLSVVSVASPVVTLSSSSLSFPNQIVNTPSSVETVQLQNTGTAALTIASIQMTGTDSGNYSYSADPTKPCPISPATLGNGVSCTIDVTFTPTSPGMHNSAQVTITDNDGGVSGSTQTIALTGTGIQLSSISVTPSPASVIVGNQLSFTAMGTYSDDSTQNLTTSATWSSSNMGIATISNAAGSQGRATGIAVGGPITITATSGTISGTANLTVTPTPLQVTSGALPNGQVGVLYPNTTIQVTGGTPPYTWSVASGALPAGLTLNSTTGTISGTPTASGTFSMSVKITDSSSPQETTTVGYSITIIPAVVTISTASLPSGTVNQAYSFTVAATGGTSPYTWTLSGVPGLAIDSTTGEITGTPTQAGSFTAVVTATDSETPPQSSTVHFPLTIISGLAITSPALANGITNTAYSATETATGGTQPYSWSLSGVPGLSINATTGAISGAPTTAGTYTATVKVTDSEGTPQSTSVNYTVVIAAQLQITTASLPSGQVGVAYTTTNLALNGGIAPYAWSITGLPTGLNGSSSGQISGTPTVGGTFTVTASVTDSTSPNKQTAQTTYTLVVSGASQTISFSALPNVTYGAAPITLTATASSQLPVSYSVTGPATVSGSTLTITGAGTVTVTASQAGNADYAAATPVPQSFTVSKAALTVTAANASMVYGAALPSFTYTITGFVNADTQGTATTGAPVESTTATSSSPVGTYPITLTQGTLAAANYTFTLVNGTLTINSAVVPTVVSYQVLWGSENYNLIGSTRDRLPWQITGIRVIFSEAITKGNVSSLSGVSATSFSGLGTNTLTWTINPVAIGTFATTLAGSGPNALTDATGSPLAGGAGFAQEIKVLEGDFNDDGVVNSQDIVDINNATSGPYNVFADTNGDGVINSADVLIARSRIGTSLP